MTQKPSILVILVGSILLALADAVIFNTLGKEQLYQAIAGFFITTFVALLFLTSFVSSKNPKQPYAKKHAGSNTRSRRSTNYKGNQSTRGNPKGEQQGRVGSKSRANYRDRPTRKRDSSRNNNMPASTGYDHNLIDQPPVDGNIQDDIGNTNRLSGIIKWYDKRKGFGFLLFEDNEIFFHRNALKSPISMIKEETPVEFVLGESPKGQQALDIHVFD